MYGMGYGGYGMGAELFQGHGTGSCVGAGIIAIAILILIAAGVIFAF